MSKFSGATSTKRRPLVPQSVMATVDETETYEGGRGYTRDEKSELFLLAVTNMVGEDTFYEGAGARDKRFRDLVAKVAKKDPDWIARFIPFLRNEMHMRSAAVVMAVEAARVGVPNGRQMIDSACVRADEPAEVLGYWLSHYHKGTVPKAIKKGLSDAAARLYTERNAIKYDGGSRGVRMGDVIEMTHAVPREAWQSELYRYLLDQRHHGDGQPNREMLPMIWRNRAMLKVPQDRRRETFLSLADEQVALRGLTWEAVSGYIGGEMTAEVWERIIPNMGYMALLRNLRNFDNAGVSDEVADWVAAKLMDPEEVARSRQFPFRFVSAYRAAESDRWSKALSKALDLSTKNIPLFEGETLVLTDTSASMTHSISARSSVEPAMIAALFAVAVTKRGSNAKLVQYADGSQEIPVSKGASVIRTTASLVNRTGEVGHGTQTFQALDRWYSGQDRVIIFTDMQAFRYDNYDAVIDRIQRAGGRIYSFDLGGYAATHASLKDGRYEFGGFSDASFRMMKMIEANEDGAWPF